MKTKLTLTVDKQRVLEAKRIAKRRNTSVSAIFEDYLASLSKMESRKGPESLGLRLRGKWKVQGKTDREQDPRLDYLLAKHGKREA